MNLTKNKLFLISIIFLFIGLRILFINFPFWGLEYEDSFIYNDTARYLSFEYDYKSMPFKCQSCLDGSYEKCTSYGSFGGHFLTFPYLISIINYIFSYNYNNVFILNFFISISILILIIRWTKQNSNSFSLPIFIILLSLTPFITLFNTSGLSETLSSLFVLIFFLSVFKLNEIDFKFSFTFLIAFLTLIISILIKRENLTLLVFLFIIPFLRYYFNQRILVKNYIMFALSTSIVILALIYKINVLEVESNEGVDVGSPTFNFTNFFINIQQLVLAILNYSYWGITGIVFIISTIYFFIKKYKSKIGLFSLVLILLYIVVYCSHYRSYYQVKFNIVHPFETLRYSTNYFPLIAIFISSQNFPESKVRKLFNNNYIMFLSFILLAYNVFELRINLSDDEYFSRIRPVETTLNHCKKNDIIITDIPIIFHCFASSNQTIVDLYSLNQTRLDNLLVDGINNNIFYLKPKNDNYDRYKLLFNDNNFSSMIWNDRQYKLLKYNSNDSSN